jgi:arylsulfatase A-like enzyme
MRSDATAVAPEPTPAARRKPAPWPLPPAVWILATLLALGGGPWGCGRAERGGRASGSAPDLRIDRIVLVTLDTLRADHLGCYGYPRPTSPFLDELSRRGVLFDRAFAPMPTTAPSHASLFTSLYPIQHRVLMNGHVLGGDFVTLAQLAHGRGYRTAAFVSAPYPFTAGGLQRGFQTFGQPKGKAQRPANETVDQALRWIQERGPGDRFLLWLHLYDPHQPLEPPARLLRTFTDGPPAKRSAHARFLLEKQRVDFDFWGRNTERMLRTIDAYDAEVLFADEQTGRLFRALEDRGLDARSLWIVVADHGEGLGNHRWLEHGQNVHGELVHVPLILRFSSGAFQGRRVHDVVELVDVLPTIADLIGASTKEQVLPVQGTSLLRLLRPAGEAFPAKYAFLERRQQGRLRPPEERPAHGEYGLQDRSYKYIHRVDGEDELYDSRTDPYEMENLVGRGGPEEGALRRELLRRIEVLRRGLREGATVADPEQIEGLRALGYVE